MRKTRSKRPRLLFVTDPWNTLDHPNDTTLRLMQEALNYQVEIYWTTAGELVLHHDLKGSPKVQALCRSLESVDSRRHSNDFHFRSPKWIDLDSLTHLFYRLDPPLDLHYTLPLQILDYLSSRGVEIHSPPRTLFSVNEKWAPLHFAPELLPETLVTADSTRLLQFLDKKRKAVLKPLYQAQSKGVHILDRDRLSVDEVGSILKSATEDHSLPVLLQAFLPKIRLGETRLWFARGKCIATSRKIPAQGESIINMDRGGRLDRHALTSSEKKAVQKISRYLKKQKILFCAVDLIDGKITDFNHSSPGLLVGMEKITKTNLAKLALDLLF